MSPGQSLDAVLAEIRSSISEVEAQVGALVATVNSVQQTQAQALVDLANLDRAVAAVVDRVDALEAPVEPPVEPPTPEPPTPEPPVEPPAIPSLEMTIVQAEVTSGTGGKVSSENPGATGNAYIGEWRTGSRFISFDLSKNSTIAVALRYRNAHIDSVRQAKIGTEPRLLQTPRTTDAWTNDAWWVTSPVTWTLTAGRHTLEIVADEGFVDLDEVQFIHLSDVDVVPVAGQPPAPEPPAPPVPRQDILRIQAEYMTGTGGKVTQENPAGASGGSPLDPPDYIGHWSAGSRSIDFTLDRDAAVDVKLRVRSLTGASRQVKVGALPEVRVAWAKTADAWADNAWTEPSLPDGGVLLTAGRHTLTITADDGNFVDLDWIELSCWDADLELATVIPPPPPPPPVVTPPLPPSPPPSGTAWKVATVAEAREAARTWDRSKNAGTEVWLTNDLVIPSGSFLTVEGAARAGTSDANPGFVFRSDPTQSGKATIETRQVSFHHVLGTNNGASWVKFAGFHLRHSPNQAGTAHSGYAIMQGITAGAALTRGIMIEDVSIETGDGCVAAVGSYGPYGGGIYGTCRNVSVKPYLGQEVGRLMRYGGSIYQLFKVTDQGEMWFYDFAGRDVGQDVPSDGIGSSCATDGNLVILDLCMSQNLVVHIIRPNLVGADGAGVNVFSSPHSTVHVRGGQIREVGRRSGNTRYCNGTAALNTYGGGRITYDGAVSLHSVQGSPVNGNVVRV